MAEDSLKAFMAENAIKVSELGIVTGKQIGRASCRERVGLYV